MLGNPLAAICGLFFCIVMALIWLTSVRRSYFGWLIIYIEYFYVLGMGVYPLLISGGFIDYPSQALNYESTNNGISIAAFFHVILYGLGAICGYFLARPLARIISLKVISFAENNRINNYTWFYLISVLSLFFSGLYFSLVGIETALLNASFARGGDFSGLAGFEQYQFLKTLAMIGLYAMVFVPYIIFDGKRVKSTFIIISLIALSTYLLTVGRIILLDTLGLFMLFYFGFGKSRTAAYVLGYVMFFLMLFIFVFGKVFVSAFAAYLFGSGSFELITKEESGSAVFFGHFSSLIYSIDSGIKTFLKHGPGLSKANYLALIGFIPSFIYSSLGLEFMSYQLVDPSESLSCINTTFVPIADSCSIPPYFPAASAYLLPLSGGFIFAFVRFLIYSILEVSWIALKDRRPYFLWFPLFLLFILNRLMLFIPNTTSSSCFIFCVFIFILKTRKVLVK